MIYLTGVHSSAAVAAAEAWKGKDYEGFSTGLGLLSQPGTYGLRRVREYPWWAADNGCFSANGGFDEPAWWRWIWQVRRASQGYSRYPGSFCLFATAPDVVGDAVATYRRGYMKLHHLRNHGLPAAFVAQNGMESAPWIRYREFWDQFDCLFIGGTTDWKLGPSAAWLAGEARARRKWVHMGRVNGGNRLAHAARIGCLSADGTLLRFGPDANLPRVRGWFDDLARTQTQARYQLDLMAWKAPTPVQAGNAQGES